MLRLHLDASKVSVLYIHTYPALDIEVTLALIALSVVSSAFLGGAPGSGAGVACCICCRSIAIVFLLLTHEVVDNAQPL